jgi:hypothetical protein
LFSGVVTFLIVDFTWTLNIWSKWLLFSVAGNDSTTDASVYSKCKTIENFIELIDANSTRIIFADREKKNAYYSDLRRRNNDVVIKYLYDCREKVL